MAEKMSEQFLRDIDEFINDNGIWPDFIQFMQDKGYDLEEETPLDEQVAIKH